VVPRSVVNTVEANSDAENAYANNLILGILIALSGVALATGYW